MTGVALREQVPAPVRQIVRALRAAGHAAFVVGGSVRDLLAGRAPEDWDVATAATPDRVQSLFDDTALTGERFGTVTVRTGGMAIEVTTFRRDAAYSDRRRPDSVTFSDTIDDDLARRDFTINAVALDLEGSPALVDPHGGLADLAAGMVRAVGDPAARFDQDALRLVRACRFAGQLAFAIESQTAAAMRRHAVHVRHVAAERLRDELLKLLARAERPSRGLGWMLRTGVLAETLPELLASVGVVQNHYHRFDVWTHTLFAVDAVPRTQPLVRVAALLHDMAKPGTRVVRDGRATFHRHEVTGAEEAQALLSRLRFSREDIDFVAALVRQHMFQYGAEWSDSAVRRFVRRVGEERLDALFLLRQADARAAGYDHGRRAALDELRARIRRELASPSYPRRLALSGHDVMQELALPPGREVGRVLERLWEFVLEHPEENSEAGLRRRLNQLREAAEDS